jgi:hypothetical protein
MSSPLPRADAKRKTRNGKGQFRGPREIGWTIFCRRTKLKKRNGIGCQPRFHFLLDYFNTMPTIAIGETVAIYDSTGAHLGDFRIYDNRIGSWLGTFSPLPAYEHIRHLLTKRAGSIPAPNFVDEAKEKIAALGLWARSGNDRFEIRDVRLYEDANGISGSFRQAT